MKQYTIGLDINCLIHFSLAFVADGNILGKTALGAIKGGYDHYNVIIIIAKKRKKKKEKKK